MSRPRTSTCVSRAALLALLLAAFGCHKSNALAELVKKDGPVDRAESDGPWANADVGAKYALGDAARTGDGGARLEVVGGAIIDMTPHTVLRFGGKSGGGQISVEAGAIDLSNTSSYGLDVGEVKLGNGAKLHITAVGGGKSSFELAVGTGTITTLTGQTIELEPGKGIEMGVGASVVTATIDAGVRDAAAPPADAALDVDAAVPAVADATIDVTGKKAEVQAPGEKDFKPIPAGQTSLAKGSKVRIGNGTTAKIAMSDVTLTLAGGSRVSVDESLVVEVGTIDATVPVSGKGNVGVPGGSVAIAGSPQSPGESRLEVAGKDAKVTVLRGAAKLTSKGGATLDMNRGESAKLAADRIQPLEAIPREFDVRVAAGESITIHDPRPPTAVQFQFGGKCGDGVIELDHDAGFRTAKLSAGKDTANLMVQPGGWYYRLRCSEGGAEGKAVASGRIVVGRDDGRRPLPPKQPPNPVDADGRTWRISYQSLIPNIEVHGKPGGSAYTLHLAQSGKDQTFDGGATITVPGTQLKEGTYTYWMDRDGVKEDKVSTLKIEFDQTAPQVYIEAPANAQPFGASIDVRGAVLLGWTAAVEGVELPLDKQHRFQASVQPPPGLALAIRLSHPQRGVHYYLRRQK